MKTKEYQDVMASVPKFAVLFEVSKVPAWASDSVKKGDIILDNDYNLGNARRIDLSVGYLKFYGYLQLRGQPIEQYSSIEAALVKKFDRPIEDIRQQAIYAQRQCWVMTRPLQKVKKAV